jgi:hypothetical protein
MVDYGAALQVFFKKADGNDVVLYGIADTYQNLKISWEDPRPIPTEQQLSTAYITAYKNAKILDIKKRADDVRSALVSGCSPVQVSSWNDKYTRACRLINSQPFHGDIEQLQRECELRGRGEEPLELAKTQAAIADKLSYQIATIDGMEKAALTSLKAAKSISEIDSAAKNIIDHAEALLKSLNPYEGI